MKKLKVTISISIGILLTLTLAIPGLPAEIDRGAAVPSEGIPEKLRGLDIKDYFIGSDFKRAGTILVHRGSVVVIHKSTGEAYFGMAGDNLYESDALETLPDSRCRIELLNEDVISMAANTRLELNEVAFEKEKRSFLGLLRGKVMFYALRLFSRKTNMMVKTPTAVCGIRGTKFAVHVYKLDEKEAGRDKIVLANLGGSIPYLAALDNEKTGTDVVFYDGLGYVDGKTIGPGQKFENGIIKDATKEEMEALERDTSVGGAPAEPEKEYEVPAETGEPDPDFKPATEDRIANENQIQTTGGLKEVPLKSGFGYFTALLSNSGEGYSYGGTYTSTTRQDFSGGTVEAYSNGENMVATGQSAWGGGTPYLRSIKHGGQNSPDLGTTRPITTAELGANAYLTWGWWNCPGSVTIGTAGDYAVSNLTNEKQGYYIFGPNPTDIGALSGEYTYTGSAYGTIQRLNVVNQDMEGSFNCTLNFDTQLVKDFDLSVSGGEYSASIENAAGNLMAGNNHINLNAGFGWKLGPTASMTDATDGAVKGSVYGPNGEAVGGVWNMENAEAYHATGIFQGVK